MSPDLPAPMAALGLVLDSPLQSWGVDSRFQRRGTGAHPSKSAVLGLAAAALGIAKHASSEAAALEPLRKLRLTTCRVPRPGTRRSAGLVGRVMDYHTIGGGQDTSTSWGYLSTPRKAGGGPFGTVVTQREYLTDAVFVAILEGEPAVLERIAHALNDPVWGVWLGRKSCPPATPIRGPICADAQAALAHCLDKLGVPPMKIADFDRYREVRQDDIPLDEHTVVDAMADEPVSFGQREHVGRRFVHRRPGQAD